MMDCLSDMKHAEDNLQMAVARYLDLTNYVWCHVANERKASPQAGKRLRAKGVKSGVPDCLIFNQRNGFKGLALELKIKPNKPTENQKQWLSDLSVLGWLCKVAYDLDEAINIIDHYGKNNK
jgi:hypothetical protein